MSVSHEYVGERVCSMVGLWHWGFGTWAGARLLHSRRSLAEVWRRVYQPSPTKLDQKVRTLKRPGTVDRELVIDI